MKLQHNLPTHPKRPAVRLVWVSSSKASTWKSYHRLLHYPVTPFPYQLWCLLKPSHVKLLEKCLGACRKTLGPEPAPRRRPQTFHWPSLLFPKDKWLQPVGRRRPAVFQYSRVRAHLPTSPLGAEGGNRTPGRRTVGGRSPRFNFVEFVALRSKTAAAASPHPNW